MRITKRFKNYFLRGLAVLLPTILTLAILAWAYGKIQKHITVHINTQLVRVLVAQKARNLADLKARDPEAYEKFLTDYRESLENTFVKGYAGSAVGFFIALLLVFLVGALLASVVGRAIWRIVEAVIMNTPILRRVYPYVKQITDFVLTQEEQQKMFSRVVAVEYPRKGIWSIGFVTGSGLRKITASIQKEFLTVLVPNSPTPITGYVIIVPKEQTIALDMTVEEAFRFAVSAGVIAPSQHNVATLPRAYAERQGKQ